MPLKMADATLPLLALVCLSVGSWYTYVLLVRMHEVPDLGKTGGVRRLDRYDQLAEYVFGECGSFLG